MSQKMLRNKWKSEMTDRERHKNQLLGKPVDRCFNMEFGYWEENFKKWPVFYENGIDNTYDAYNFFGFDRHEEIYFNTWMAPSYKEGVIEVRKDTKIIMNEDGNIAEIPIDGHNTIPHFIKSSIVTPDDWKKCKEERFIRNDPSRKINLESTIAEHPKDRDYPLGLSAGSLIGKIRNLLTFEGLAYACCDYPEMVEDMVETSCVLIEDCLKQVLPYVDVDFIYGWEDICFKNGPIVTPTFFRDVVMPRYKRIRKILDEFGVEIWMVDSDGDIRSILPFMIEGGISHVFPYEVNGSGHPGEVLEKYDGQIGILGGIDKMKLLAGRDETEKYMQSLVPYVKKGRFIPYIDHLCPPDVKQEDYLYYLDLKERLFGV